MRSVLKNDRALSSVDAAALQSKFNNMPKLILDSLIKRFGETSGTKTTLTTASKTKLMSYMFALMLMVDSFVIDTQTVADDLTMPVTKFVVSSLPAYCTDCSQGQYVVQIFGLYRRSSDGW